MPYKASAPGSLMLFGEHAVLQGEWALVAAIDARAVVTITPTDNQELSITSALLGDYRVSILDLAIKPPFQFVIASVRQFAPLLNSGLHIEIGSTVTTNTGLGSSSAVTIATLHALAQWLHPDIIPTELLELGLKVVTEVQTIGSGADLSAAIMGGVVAYRMLTREMQPISHAPLIQPIYVGYKTKTADVVKYVQARARNYPSVYQHLYPAIGQCAQQAIVACQHQNWQALGELANMQQGLMEALGVNDANLSALLWQVRALKGVVGAKISGSGLGDCIIAFLDPSRQRFVLLQGERGESQENLCAQLTLPAGMRLIPTQLTNDGVRKES